MATHKKAAAKDAVPAIEKILGDADALIRRRMEAIGLDVHQVILAVSLDGTGIIRSNVPPGTLVEMAYMLEDIADQDEAPPRKDDTQH